MGHGQAIPSCALSSRCGSAVVLLVMLLLLFLPHKDRALKQIKKYHIE